MNDTTGLGRGLASLIPEEGQDEAVLRDIPLSDVSTNPRQPRGSFDRDELEGLAQSIRDVGVLQPVVVRRLGDDQYELIAGERRLRAAELAGLSTLPAVVREADDTDLLKEALIENIHRVELNPLEEAAAYQQLLEDFDVTQQELADRLGKSRPTISNALRLLSLPDPVRRRVAAGVLSAGHAKALLALDEPAEQQDLAERIVAEGMTVRSTEEAVRLRLMDREAAESGVPGPGGGTSSSPGGSSGRSGGDAPTPPGLVELQEDLSDRLRARVRIRMGAEKGRLTVEFGSVDDLERIVGILTRGLTTDAPEG